MTYYVSSGTLTSTNSTQLNLLLNKTTKRNAQDAKKMLAE